MGLCTQTIIEISDKHLHWMPAYTLQDLNGLKMHKTNLEQKRFLLCILVR